MRSEAEIYSTVLEKAYKLEAENAQLKAELAQTKHAEQQIREHEFQRGYQEAEAKVWGGLKPTNQQLAEALAWLGPTGTRYEARVKACVEYVIARREQALKETGT